MSKFKAGDKVKVVSAKSNVLWYADKIGSVFTVESYCEGAYTDLDYYRVEELDKGIWAKDLELATTPKTMLKNGMRVKLRNGSEWTYLDGVFAKLKPEYKHGMDWAGGVIDWDNNLNAKGASNYDVMEITAAPKLVVEYFEYHRPTQVIWKRVEKSEAELRLEQMQAKAAELQNEMAKLQKDIAEGKA